jgi:hypothetical protein
VTVYIAAPAGLIWDLVSDVTRIGEFSPETFEAQWLDGASEPRAGARFRGHVRRKGHRDQQERAGAESGGARPAGPRRAW